MPLRIGAEAEHRHRAETDSGLQRDGERLIDATERLDGEAQSEVIATLTAHVLGERKAEQPHLPHLRDDLEGQCVRAVRLVGLRRHHGVSELADEARELALVVAEVVREGVVAHGILRHNPVTPVVRYAIVRLVCPNRTNSG